MADRGVTDIMKRVAIIGGGGAGMATAWLLDPEYSVTLYEQDDHLGGHASTVDVTLDADTPTGSAPVTIPADLGPEFLSLGLYPTTLRYFQAVGVPTQSFLLTVTLFDSRQNRPLLLPPVRPGRIGWSAFHPRVLPQLLELRRLVARAPTDVGLEAPVFTVGEMLDAAKASAAFREHLFYPLISSGWCIGLDEFREFSAYNVMRYTALSLPPGATPAEWVEVKGGMRTYFDMAAAQLEHTRILTSTPVARIQRQGETYLVSTVQGTSEVFDHIVLATNARQAHLLLREVQEATELRAALGSVRHMSTRIAIHGDTRLLPPRRRDWSVLNTYFDGAHSHNTIWKSWHQPPSRHVFKSWVTYLDTMPDPLYAERTFEHVIPDRAYFKAQREIAQLQGRDGVWVAGTYSCGIDSHESAIRSAVAVAERLARGTSRLHALTEAVPVDRMRRT